MRVTLTFKDVPEDIADVMVDISVEDQSDVDAPAPRLLSTRIGPFALRRAYPDVIADIDLPVPNDDSELVLIARVKTHTRDNQPIQFLNTTSTPLPSDSSKVVQVVLSRIV